MPSNVTRAMLRGWHSRNGVTLGNGRLGFVCTRMTTDGQPGLEGYDLEHDRELGEDERLRVAPDEEPPDFDPGRAPCVPASTWPPERLRKIARNYTMDYVRNVLPELVGAFGADDAWRLGGITGLLIGMQDHAATDLEISGSSAENFAG